MLSCRHVYWMANEWISFGPFFPFNENKNWICLHVKNYKFAKWIRLELKYIICTTQGVRMRQHAYGRKWAVCASVRTVWMNVSAFYFFRHNVLSIKVHTHTHFFSWTFFYLFAYIIRVSISSFICLYACFLSSKMWFLLGISQP